MSVSKEPLYLVAIHENFLGRRWATVIEVPPGHNVKRALSAESVLYAYAYGDKETCEEIATGWNRLWKITDADRRE